ncbi:MAG: hypothetical protein ABSH20_25840 [Tepidisphaeraceae bacterium]|jgi:nitroimidazol reductase NimA-like FMN-containing flavoprotein (pyridoxamine 5'-phosphate oxidase superfamily)
MIEMTPDEIEAFLSDARIGRLSMADADIPTPSHCLSAGWMARSTCAFP